MADMKDFSLDYFRLDGKVAMVTGANMGLGMAYAVAFAKAGADLFIPHFTDDISEIKALIEAEGRRVEFLQGDLTDKTYLDQVVKLVLRSMVALTSLLTTKGVSKFNPDEYKDEDWAVSNLI